MIQKGWENIKVVFGGGAAMEKYFEYYTSAAVTKITNPRTGKVTIIKKNQ